jgi:hypothetical protein
VKTLSGHEGHRFDSPRLHKILHNINRYWPMRGFHVAASHWLTLPRVNKPLDHLDVTCQSMIEPPVLPNKLYDQSM